MPEQLDVQILPRSGWLGLKRKPFQPHQIIVIDRKFVRHFGAVKGARLNGGVMDAPTFVESCEFQQAAV